MATEQVLTETAIKNLEECRKQLDLIQNPSPIIIIACTTFALGILYMLFLLFITSTPSGIWLAPNKTTFRITHNGITGNVSIEQGPIFAPFKTGKSRGASLTVAGPDGSGTMTGVWTDKQIIWIDPDGTTHIWNRETRIG
jgi:hypothetical protein